MAKNTSGTLTANGDSTVTNFPGGELFFGATGTFGSGNVTLYASFDEGVQYVIVPNSTFTTAGVFSATLPNCYVKLTLAGATSPSLYWTLASQQSV